MTDQVPSGPTVGATTVGAPTVGRPATGPQRPLLVIEHGSTPLGQYLRDLSHYGDLIRVMALRDLKLRYRQTALGAVWVVVQPVLSAAILGFVFGRVAKLSTDGVPIFLFAYAGMVSWNAFNQTVTRTTSSLLANAALVSKIFFPRLILPLASTAGVVIDFVISLVVLLGILVAAGRAPGVAVLLLPVWLALLLLCSLGLGTLAASLSVRYRDLAQITPVLLQLLLYASPVAYAVSAVPDRYLTLYYLNPLVALLEGFRWSLLGTNPPEASRLIPSVLVSVALFVAGMVTLEKKERGFADVI
ncbi:MAG: lipopolysaccharide transport system permease protein [Actinomycetota bacterium]|nr:lipopolysaccharide transport system permease protein [Actinomycetota bacterium]